ncbi:MAG: hypothetical protein QNK89_03285 [Lacinutrix sp.]|uniref:hypothetical protein n=1 Tax=Lacinutrix sp. TaxID=1937692 RepID=UPI0030A810A2
MKNYPGILDKSTFTCGEEITFLFKNMKGFALKDSLAFPDMNIFVNNKKGDTLMSQKNLFKDTSKGYTLKDLNLRSMLAFATPMMTNNSYIMHINISDKNSDAYYNVKKDFSLVESTFL